MASLRRVKPSRATWPLAALAAVLALALILAACGGSEEEPESQASGGGGAEQSAGSGGGDGGQAELSDEDRVRAAIEALLVSQDNEFVCGEVLSRNLLRTAYGDLQGCLNGRAPELLAESVDEIAKLRVDGDTAEAEAISAGGLYDGELLTIEAVRDGDQWQIDLFIADVPVGP